MMATMPSQFGGHPGAMPGHAGVTHGGPPMNQGHPSGQGMPGGGQQPGASMGQQIHPGATGPGGPQASQAGPMMGGMMQAGGPSAASGNGGPSVHALSHLTPAATQMFNPQQMHNAMTNNHHQLAHVQQQQQMQQQQLQQQRQRMLQHTAMQQNGGIPINHSNNPMNPQFRPGQGNPNVPRVPLTGHLQHQQQQVQMNQAQLAHQQQIAHQISLQQSASQPGSNQSQPTPQPQIRPQSQMSGGPDSQTAATAQQQQAQIQQHQQHQQQQQQQHQQQQQQQHQQAQQQHQQQQQQAQAAQQDQHQQQQRQQQQHAQHQQQQQHAQAQAQQAQAQQQAQQTQAQQQQQQQQQAQQQAAAHQQAAAMMQPRMPVFKGASVLKLVNFADQLSHFSTRSGFQNELSQWQVFVDRFFSQTGVIRQQLYYASDQSTKQFEISPTPTLARYYWTHFNSGVHNIQMVIEANREVDLPNGGHLVLSDKASFIYWLSNGHQLVASGGLKVQFDQFSKIDLLEILTTSHEEFIPRTRLLQSAVEFPETKHSPNQSKAAGKKAAQQRQKQAQASQDHTPHVPIPSSTINDMGVTPSVSQFLEVAEAMSILQPLFRFSRTQSQLSATEALAQLVSSYQNQPNIPQHGFPASGFNPAFHNQQQSLNPNLQVPPGQRTPNHFVSPGSANHLALPGQATAMASPATIHNMSPAIQSLAIQQQAMQQQQAPTSVGMGHSASQQGTNTSVGTGSQGTSTNASPNIPNKRRRASAVKGEDDGGGPGVDINGVPGSSKVKPSPRLGGKRHKANG